MAKKPSKTPETRPQLATEHHKTVHEVLRDLQQKLKVGKDQNNDFGGFNYRSADDILAKLIPMLGEYNEVVTYVLKDHVSCIGNRFYVVATGTLRVNNEEHTNTAYAREAEQKTKMDDAQITGSTSSYARKYCMQGHFQLQGHTPDADTMNPNEIAEDKRDIFITKITNKLNSAKTVEELNGFTNGLMKEAESLGFLKDLKTTHGLVKVGLEASNG